MNTVSDLLKALSEPIRIRILALLTRGELCVCDVMEVLNLPQSTASRHLGRLRQAGLVQDRRTGKWVYFRLAETDSPAVGGLRQIVQSVLAEPPVRDDLIRLDMHRKTKNC